jgi:L-threonylcarbamoyladenylate synthase
MGKKCVQWDNVSIIDQLASLLRSNRVIASTTDTVFGLLAPYNLTGFTLLNEIKNREKKPYIILLPCQEEIFQFVDLTKKLHIEKFLRKCWPGPVTGVFKAKDSVPDFVKGVNGTVALRVPAHDGLQRLLHQLQAPLFSTSANLAGHPIPNELSDVDPDILTRVACIVLDQGESFAHIPSTMLDCMGDTIRVLRVGAYPIDQLEKIYGERFS